MVNDCTLQRKQKQKTNYVLVLSFLRRGLSKSFEDDILQFHVQNAWKIVK
mgnify:CR=1 FL=1